MFTRSVYKWPQHLILTKESTPPGRWNLSPLSEYYPLESKHLSQHHFHCSKQSTKYFLDITVGCLSEFLSSSIGFFFFLNVILTLEKARNCKEKILGDMVTLTNPSDAMLREKEKNGQEHCHNEYNHNTVH